MQFQENIRKLSVAFAQAPKVLSSFSIVTASSYIWDNISKPQTFIIRATRI